ncbi:MAG: hypothetical protein D6748_07035 [Calditrichaeota bacterium]|nr:MAG: hypothetical protein D6748_07035 [Calditrichota bacterium]
MKNFKNTKIFLWTLCLIAGVLWFPENVSAQIVVVVPANSYIDSLTITQLKKIFKGKAIAEGQQSPIQIVEYASVSDRFYKALYGQSAYAMGKYWLRMIFSGERVLPPKSFTSPEQFVRFMQEHYNSIGFLPLDVYKSIDKSLVRHVFIDGKRFDDPQYVFK